MSDYLGNNVTARVDATHIVLVAGRDSHQVIYLDRAAANELGEVIRRFLGSPTLETEVGKHSCHCPAPQGDACWHTPEECAMRARANAIACPTCHPL